MRSLFLITIVLAAFHLSGYSQEMQEKIDSIPPAGKDSLLISIPEYELIPNDFFLLELGAKNLIIEFEREIADPNWKPSFDTRYVPPKFTYFEDELIRISPFSFSFDNGYQGGWMGGVNNYMEFNDRFKVNLNLYGSSSFYGPFYPDRYNNLTLAVNMKYQIHDRVRLVAFAEASLREGMNPALAPMINGGYNFGGGLEFRITKNIGIGFGVVNSYYRKSWTTNPYASPVVW